MRAKKKKISELTLADSLTGLYTIGCKVMSGIQTSVKVSLETIQTAYGDMLTEIKNARTATKAANTAASNANTAKLNAEAATSKANTATANAITATDEAKAATTTANAAATRANTAATNADNARVELETIKANTKEATKDANDAARLANDKAAHANSQGVLAGKAADRLNALSDHRDEIRDGYWWRWDETTGEWRNTGEIAKGNVMYATFDVDPVTGELSMYTDGEYAGADFELDDKGCLLVII